MHKERLWERSGTMKGLRTRNLSFKERGKGRVVPSGGEGWYPKAGVWLKSCGQTVNWTPVGSARANQREERGPRLHREENDPEHTGGAESIFSEKTGGFCACRQVWLFAEPVLGREVQGSHICNGCWGKGGLLFGWL